MNTDKNDAGVKTTPMKRLPTLIFCKHNSLKGLSKNYMLFFVQNFTGQLLLT